MQRLKALTVAKGIAVGLVVLVVGYLIFALFFTGGLRLLGFS